MSSESSSERFKENWPWFAAGLALLLLLYFLTPILTPFVIGAGLGYLGDPIVDWLQRRRLSRTAAVAVVFVVITGLALLALVLVVPMLQEQFVTLIHKIPDWLRWIQDVALPRLGITLPAGVGLDIEGLRKIVTEHWSKAGGIAAVVWARVSGSGGALLVLVANLTLVPVVTFYLMRDWDNLVAWIANIVPRRVLPKLTQFARETDDTLGAFMRGQLSVMAALAVIYSVGLMIVGVDLGLLIGLTAGLISFVPYLGFIVGFGLASIAVLVQTQELLPLLWVGLVFGIGQLLESSVLTPTLVGDRIGLHPVAVIFAVMAGGQLFGFVGVLLALPVAAVIAVMLRHTKERWLQSRLYLEEPPAPVSQQDLPPQ